MQVKKFAILGSSGYIAPRHFEAIKAIDGVVVAQYDLRHQNTNMLDFINMCKTENVDYFVVCSPNWLHKEHCSIGLSIGADVICEKPAALCPDDIIQLQKLEIITGKKVSNIMQLRYVFESLELETYNKIKIHYHLPRNDAYFKTWKGQHAKSGGIVTNIGIHIFDLVLKFCGDGGLLIDPVVYYQDDKEIVGKLFLKGGEVDFTLSVKPGVPERLFEINGKKIDFTDYGDDLHIRSYTEILNKKGFSLEDAFPSVEFCYNLTKNRE